MSEPIATLHVRGVFRVIDADGVNRTPRKRKEQGLLGLLALSAQRRLTRSKIKAMLWSDRTDEQAAVSLRRALYDLRAALGPARDALKSNRTEIWLSPDIAINKRPDLAGEAELLETVDVPDPQFEDWLRDLRQADNAPQTQTPHLFAPKLVPNRADTLVIISVQNQGESAEEGFLVSFLADTLSSRFAAEARAEVVLDDDVSRARMEAAETVIRLELNSAIAQELWNLHLRAFADRSRRFLWSGRFNMKMDFRAICEGPDVAAFASRAMTHILARYQSYKLASRSSYVMLQRATQRLFSSDREQFELAEAELLDLADHDDTGTAQAWRAFGKLTQVLELGLDPKAHLDETDALLKEAQALSAKNPLVLGLAAMVVLKMTGDGDYGRFLAREGLQSCDQNPYAMLALSQACIHAGDFETAHGTAVLGQNMASGLPNAFFWDMQACLTALTLSDLPAARSAAERALAQKPRYRPALRYLIALLLLENDFAGARHYADRLRHLEPNFQFKHLTENAYPMHTLRRSGLGGALAEKVGLSLERMP